MVSSEDLSLRVLTSEDEKVIREAFFTTKEEWMADLLRRKLCSPKKMWAEALLIAESISPFGHDVVRMAEEQFISAGMIPPTFTAKKFCRNCGMVACRPDEKHSDCTLCDTDLGKELGEMYRWGRIMEDED